MCPQNLFSNMYFKYYVKTEVLWLVIMGQSATKVFSSTWIWLLFPHNYSNRTFTSLIHTKKHANSHTQIHSRVILWSYFSHYPRAVWVNTAVRASTCLMALEKWSFPEKSLTSDLSRAGKGCQQANALLCGQMPFNPIIVTRQLLVVQNSVPGNGP